MGEANGNGVPLHRGEIPPLKRLWVRLSPWAWQGPVYGEQLQGIQVHVFSGETVQSVTKVTGPYAAEQAALAILAACSTVEAAALLVEGFAEECVRPCIGADGHFLGVDVADWITRHQPPAY